MNPANDFDRRLSRASGDGLRAVAIETVQVNLGLACNRRCAHCHLDGRPSRKEMMDWGMMELVLDACRSARPKLVDLTGGAPELNPHFRRFVEALRKEGHPVQARTNLTVLLDRGNETLPEFLRGHEVQLAASLPCYLEENVEAQRGKGAFQKSIAALRRLNALGYGAKGGLPLHLVHNPTGPFLPPAQADLEKDYRRELGRRCGVTFSNLFTIVNMPIGRFLAGLRAQGQEEAYCRLLRDSFNPKTVEGLMCRRQVSVAWDGALYDCDFNLALGLRVHEGVPDHVRNFDPTLLATRRIVTGDHCFGCTAGSGSSCGGVLV